MTLRELVQEHPDWLDYEMVIYRSDGEYEYVGQSASVYDAPEWEDVPNEDARETGKTLIVFSGN